MKPTILLLEGKIDILKIKNDLNTYGECKLYALNYQSHKILKENNLEHEIAENLLSIDDRKIIDDVSINTTASWYDDESIRELLNFEQINLGSLIEMELLQFLVNTFGNAKMIDIIIEKESPERIISYTMINDYVERICNQKNIYIISNPPPQLSSLQSDKLNIKFNLGPHPFSVNISRKTFLKIRQIFNKITKLFFKFGPSMDDIKKQKSILLLDFNPIQYDYLLNELSSLNKNILLLNQRRPAIWNFQSFKIIKNSNCKIIYLDDFEKKINKKIDLEIKTFLSNLDKLWLLNSTFEKIFSTELNTFWYSIKESFVKICTDRFSESVKRILLLNEFFDTIDISVILEWAETGQEEKEIIFISKKKGIKSILLQHAMDPLSNTWDKYHKFVLGGYSHYISDKQALWGEIVKKLALSYEHEEKNLLLTGSPRHDIFFHTTKNIQKNGMILFATTSVTGRISFEHTTIDAYEKFNDYVKEVCNVVKKLPNMHLVVKPHPQPDFLSNITKMIKEIDPNIPILHNANLVDLINSCDLLITFNNSTVALESMILDKPTISLQVEKWAEEEPISTSGPFLSIMKVSDVEEGIKSMLYDEKLRENFLTKSKTFVKNYLSNPGCASKALAEILDDF